MSFLSRNTIRCCCFPLVMGCWFIVFLLSVVSPIFFPVTFAASYNVLDGKDCNYMDDLGMIVDETCSRVACKAWCDCRSDCAGFRQSLVHCYFKAHSCLNDMFPQPDGQLYLKPWHHGSKHADVWSRTFVSFYSRQNVTVIIYHKREDETNVFGLSHLCIPTTCVSEVCCTNFKHPVQLDKGPFISCHLQCRKNGFLCHVTTCLLLIPSQKYHQKNTADHETNLSDW